MYNQNSSLNKIKCKFLKLTNLLKLNNIKHVITYYFLYDFSEFPHNIFFDYLGLHNLNGFSDNIVCKHGE